MKKRGISAVVATVLIILITIAAVTIIWGFILPILNEKVSFEEGQVDLSIETSGGHTVWDEDAKNMTVQVKRGADDLEILGVEIISNINGSSAKNIFYNYPEPNHMVLYEFHLIGKPDSISVAAILSGNKSGEVSSILKNIPIGNVSGVVGVPPSIPNDGSPSGGPGAGEDPPSTSYTYYFDEDGDGYGNLSETRVAQTAPDRYVSNSNDCNDDNNSIYPGAIELCDDVDNNCSGYINDGCIGKDCSAGARIPYGVSDVGVCTFGILICFPEGRWLVSPLATFPVTEVCDGFDNDCDGETDEGCEKCETDDECTTEDKFSCNVYRGICEYPWCNGADMDHNGWVDTSYEDTSVWRTNNESIECSENIDAGDARKWCNGADANRDSFVNNLDYTILNSYGGTWGCTGPED